MIKKIDKHSRLYGTSGQLKFWNNVKRPQTKEEKEWVEGTVKWFAENHGDKKKDKK
ncbi:hypothetical protein [Ligilactobacillus apodemi]|uniref:Uncharacterized protein n=1 Tax=Ligilactobacillus apodemi DSM 16634 = JCM 16172 TaxID=1423724 RepID=A0A0R1TRE2_9LACO|nr:hypothetical protein [Ligilactobacillus apodemi]KRL84001.1 hypothetical protein FC32_GL001272 [Ligilactobacillus apodemi DSM 16634 = JCM 16172]